MTQDEVLEGLAPFFPVVYETLESAWQSTLDFFDHEARPFDVFLAPGLLRWWAKQEFTRLQPILGDMAVEDLANNGLSLVYRQFRLRIWKTPDGQLPDSGQSLTRDAFLRQKQVMFGFMEEPLPVALNLAILWSVDQEQRMDPLKLVCTKADVAESAPIQVDWAYEIPHPAVAMETCSVDADQTSLGFECLETGEQEKGTS